MILPPRIALQLHVDELRAELVAVSCADERTQILDELHDALDRLPAITVPGAIAQRVEPMP